MLCSNFKFDSFGSAFLMIYNTLSRLFHSFSISNQNFVRSFVRKHMLLWMASIDTQRLVHTEAHTFVIASNVKRKNKIRRLKSVNQSKIATINSISVNSSIQATRQQKASIIAKA